MIRRAGNTKIGTTTLAELVNIDASTELQDMHEFIMVGTVEHLLYRIHNTKDAILLHHAPRIADGAIWDNAILMRDYFVKKQIA